MTDGILDFLAMILVLAIVIGIGFGFILPLMNTELMSYNEDINDKSILNHSQNYYEKPEKKGITAEEIVLISQVQDEGMPSPRTIIVDDGTEYSTNDKLIEIESTYKIKVREKGIEIWGAINNIDVTLKTGLYIIEYDFGGNDINPKWKESYKVKVFR